jgi:WD40 repeat protein
MRPLKFETHAGPANAVCFNDDGSYLASGGADGKIGITKNNAKNAKNENFTFKAHSAVDSTDEASQER